MVDHVKISSIYMSTIGAVAGGIILAILNNPALLQVIMGDYYYGIYGLLLLTVLGVIYNVVFAGNSQEQPTEEQ